MPIEEIRKLFESGQLEEAKQKLAEYLKQTKLSETEQGEAYFELAKLYLNLNNELLVRYEEFLKETIADLKALQAKKKELTA